MRQSAKPDSVAVTQQFSPHPKHQYAQESEALHLSAQLMEATDDKTRARLFAEGSDALETRFPQITGLATQGQVRETELRLKKEVKGRLRAEITHIKADLLKWLLPTMPAQVAAIAALVKLL